MLVTDTFRVNIEQPEDNASEAQTRYLVSLTRPGPAMHPQRILSAFQGQARAYWESNTAAPVYAGIGAATELHTDDPDPYRSIQQQAADLFTNAHWQHGNAPEWARPRVFGGFAFSPADRDPVDWAEFPAGLFILPQFQFAWLDGESWLTANAIVASLEDVTTTIADLEHLVGTVFDASVIDVSSNSAQQDIRSESLVNQAAWEAMVRDGIRRIQDTPLEKVVLSRATRVYGTSDFDPAKVLASLRANYPDCYRFLIEPVPAHAWIGATPELLADVHQRELNTMAVAGSVRRGADSAEDDALGARMLGDPKERHEHRLVVNAIDAALRPLSDALEIDAEPALYRLRNIQHLRTSVRATLGDEHGVLEVVESLHPTPALGGTPRKAALQAISEIEQHSRGWYAGPVGWIDAEGNGQIAVAIRSALMNGSEALLFTGAGIVADSIPDREWRETELKLRPMLDALKAAG